MSEYQTAVDIVETYMQAMSTKDYEQVLALYAEDATLEDPVGSDVLQGNAAISEFYNRLGDTEITCSTTGPVRYANREIMFPFECVMKSADGTMTIAIIDHFVLNDDNKVVAMRAFWGPETVSMSE